MFFSVGISLLAFFSRLNLFLHVLSCWNFLVRCFVGSVFRCWWGSPLKFVSKCFIVL